MSVQKWLKKAQGLVERAGQSVKQALTVARSKGKPTAPPTLAPGTGMGMAGAAGSPENQAALRKKMEKQLKDSAATGTQAHKLQQQMQSIQQLLQMISNISKQQHDTAKSIIGNMR